MRKFFNYTTLVTDIESLQNPLIANQEIKSGWQLLADTMCNRWGIKVSAKATAPQVAVDPPATCPAGTSCACPAPLFDRSQIKALSFDQNTQIVLVLDSSGSMGAGDQGVDGKVVSRLDFVKSAGLDLLRDIAFDTLKRRQADADMNGMPDDPAAPAPKLGLVWFNTEDDVKFSSTTNTTCTEATQATDCTNTAAFEVPICLDGHCKLQLPRLESTEATPDCPMTPACPAKLGCPTTPGCSSGPQCPATPVGPESVSIERIENCFMRMDSDNGNPEPPAFGFTGTGAALQKARKLFDPDPSTTKVVILLSDGLHNRPEGGACKDGSTPYRDEESCWPGAVADQAYAQAIQDIRADNALFYSIPLGVTGEKSAQAIRDGELTGQVFEAHRNLGEDTVPLFAEVHAATQGQQLVRSHLTLPVIRDSHYGTPVEYRFTVEEGAKSLNVTISDYDGTRDRFQDHLNAFTMVSPSLRLPPNGPSIYRDDNPQSVQIRILDPEPGEWYLEDASWKGDFMEDRYERFYVTAYVDNPLLPSCSASTNIRVTDGSEEVHVYAQAIYKRPVASGVDYSGSLYRADGTLIPLLFEPDRTTPTRAVARVPIEDLAGNGLYTVKVTCHVSEGAELDRGEPRAEDLGSPPPEPQSTPEFVREAHAYFRVSDGGLEATPGLGGDNQDPSALGGLPPGYSPIVPYLDDCDGDGLPNAVEYGSQVDNDGDKKPDVCDRDANGNEIPDGFDVDYPLSDPEPDGVPWGADNCPELYNPDQADLDGDGEGDACDSNRDGDPFPNPEDNCPNVPNPDQADFDGDGIGDACDDNSLIANAGPDQILECTASSGAAATLNGTGSAPGGQIDYLWSAPSVILQNANQSVASGTFPLGSTVATLTVSQGAVQASDTAVVIVRDTTAPVLTVPPDVVAPVCTSVNLGEASASDVCGGNITIVNDAPASFKAGSYVVTWRAIDQFANESTGTQRVVVGLGDTTSCCPAGANIIQGTSNNDTLNGTSGVDCIFGKGAQDTIKGFGGNDFLSGGGGDDVIEGGDGNDFIDGGSGQDTLRGQNGNDILVGGAGDDWCYGGNNDDTIEGGANQDHLFGESGNDSLYGDVGFDVLDGGIGNDLLNGGADVDQCIGGSGTNTLVLCEQ